MRLTLSHGRKVLLYQLGGSLSHRFHHPVQDDSVENIDRGTEVDNEKNADNVRNKTGEVSLGDEVCCDRSDSAAEADTIAAAMPATLPGESMSLHDFMTSEPDPPASKAKPKPKAKAKADAKPSAKPKPKSESSKSAGVEKLFEDYVPEEHSDVAVDDPAPEAVRSPS